MVTLLRIAAIVFFVVGVVVAVEGLPQGVDPATHGRNLTQCLLQDRVPLEAPPPAAEEGVIGPPAPVPCDQYFPSLYILAAGVLSSLLFGGFASLLYNVRRSREVMERFDDTQGAR